jgi:hypothetical protein
MPAIPERSVFGGQTGADCAALDRGANPSRVLHGGWCPRGRKAEDGATGNRNQLKETPSANSIQRTERNLRDSDATVIFTVVRSPLDRPRIKNDQLVVFDLGRVVRR